MEQPVTSYSNLEKAKAYQKQLQTSGKKKSPSFWMTNEIDRYSVAFDSVNFHLKETLPFMVAEKWDTIKKVVFSEKLYCQKTQC